MTLRSAWPRLSVALLASAAIYSSGGCSFFYELSTTQCEVTADCRAFGPQFATTTCVNRVCVETSSETGGTTSKGGSGGSGGGNGGTASGGLDGSGGDPGEGGTGGTGGTGGGSPEGGLGGEGGGGTPPECTTNAECIEANLDQPYICRNEKCVQLITEQCPVLLPTEGAVAILKTKNKPPIVLGGFANMDNDRDRKDTKAVINWNLAFNQFNTTLGVASPRPQVVGLICQGNAALMNLEESMPHLTQEVGTPAILSTLPSDALAEAWDFTQTPEYAESGASPVFFLSTGSADLRLANLDDDGLVWHLLGDPRVLAATTASLVKRIEPHVQELRQSHFDAAPTAKGAENPETVPLRVTLVYNDDPTMNDIANVLTTPDANRPETMLTFNGATAIAASNSANYREVKIESAKYHTTPVVTNGNIELRDHPPHIVIAMATGEFPSMMSELEANWGKVDTASEGLPRPFYVLSHFILSAAAGLTAPMSTYSGKVPPLNHRSPGVAYALAQDPHSKQLYDAYLTKLRASYSGVLDVAGTENHYDGAFGLLYAVMAAAPFSMNYPDGRAIRDGWRDRVINELGTSVDIGTGPLGDTINKLGSAGYKMALWGTMGPPNFDRLSGTRTSGTSSWCMQLKSGSTTVWEAQIDSLIYNPKTATFSDPTSGTVPGCVQY